MKGRKKLPDDRDGNTGESVAHKWGLLLAISIGAEMPLFREGMSLLLAQACHFVLYRLTARELTGPFPTYKVALSPGSPSSVSTARSWFGQRRASLWAAEAADAHPGGVTAGRPPCSHRTSSCECARQPALAEVVKESPCGNAVVTSLVCLCRCGRERWTAGTWCCSRGVRVLSV